MENHSARIPLDVLRICRNLFWEKVAKTDGCWLWKPKPDARGYGRYSFEGRSIAAHRAAYFFANGNLPDDLCVCHKCDVPTCCNPEHLFLGTIADNNRDAKQKGRLWWQTHKTHAPHDPATQPRGSNVVTAKLNEATVAEIRRRYIPGRITTNALGAEFGVTGTTIQGIISGKTWKHAAGPLTQIDPSAVRIRGSKCNSARATESKVAEIRQLYAHEGVTMASLSKTFGLGHGTIQAIIRGRTWTHVAMPANTKPACGAASKVSIQ